MTRRLTTRLARLEQAAPKTPDTAECRYHGVHCGLGAYWPLDRAVADPASVQLDELLDLIAEGRRAAGLPVEPHPRDLWATDRHERVPEAEIAQRNREAAEALTEAHAENERIIAELIADQPMEGKIT